MEKTELWATYGNRKCSRHKNQFFAWYRQFVRIGGAVTARNTLISTCSKNSGWRRNNRLWSDWWRIWCMCTARMHRVRRCDRQRCMLREDLRISTICNEDGCASDRPCWLCAGLRLREATGCAGCCGNLYLKQAAGSQAWFRRLQRFLEPVEEEDSLLFRHDGFTFHGKKTQESCCRSLMRFHTIQLLNWTRLPQGRAEKLQPCRWYRIRGRDS